MSDCVTFTFRVFAGDESLTEKYEKIRARLRKSGFVYTPPVYELSKQYTFLYTHPLFQDMKWKARYVLVLIWFNDSSHVLEVVIKGTSKEFAAEINNAIRALFEK